MAGRLFGVSTYLFHGRRLERAHLAQIAAAGFDRLELVATRSHFDYSASGSIDALKDWLDETGLELHGVHAPVAEGFRNGRWIAPFSNASIDPGVRERAVHEAGLALEIARRIEMEFLIVHLGVPKAVARPGQNNRDAAIRSIEEIQGLAAPLGVRVALEVIANELSSPASLVELLEDDLERPDAGICLDFGHAHLMGDLVDGIETTSGHVVTTHVHDNRSGKDDHLPPYEGSIDWPAALMAARKVGFEGAWIFELADGGSSAAALERATRARRRFEELLSS